MNPYTSFDSNTANNDSQARLLHNRVEVFEKHLIDIYNSLCSYTRRISRLRDEGDVLSSQIFNFSQAEKLNTTMKVSFENFAETFAELQDHRHSQIQRLELKVIDEISQYGDLIRKAKDEIKASNSARNKYLNQNKDNQRNTILNSTSTAHKSFDLQAERFEARKNSDLKKLILEFIKTELQYHVKGVQILTKGYNQILGIDEEADLKEFCNHFNISPSLQNSSKKKSSSHSSLNLNDPSETSTLRRFYSNPSIISNQKFSKNSLDSKSSDEENDDNHHDEDDNASDDEDKLLINNEK